MTLSDIDMTTVLAALTEKDETVNPDRTIRIPKALVSVVSDYVKSQTDHDFPITSTTLVEYALLKLLPQEDQLAVLKYLRATETNISALVKLFNVNLDPSKSFSAISNQKLDRLDDRLVEDHALLEGVANAVALMLYDQYRLDETDTYQLLRRDGVKDVTDAVHRAGENESERQRHLHV